MDFSLLDSAPDAMVIADDAGAILFVNAHAERLFGYRSEELLGRPVEVLLPARYRTMHQVHRSAYQAAPRTRPMGLGLDLSGLRHDGAEFPAEISLSPIQVDGRSCVIAAVRDATERRKIEERARLWRKAQEEVRERDEFLSVASHELRTPVTALQLQLLHRAALRSGEGLPPDVVDRLETLERQTRRLAALVGELLDVSRMRLGKIELRREALDLAEVARDAAGHAQGDLARSGSKLALDLQPVTGAWDRTRLEQVIANLLVNAAKFGQGRPIALHVTGDDGTARVRVSDQGIGIAPEQQVRVFDRFARAVPAQNFGGLGLGLYIARQIVEAHGGTIEVASTPGAGATFTVDLPRQPPAPAPGARPDAGGLEPGRLH
ncbi:PAS domain-containing sensor histidine kinase [Anaeromyxobacter dehalogenans]|uniref:histidine kinase n=1 Tax=Anaeromyxobacter dehalogenans (strain 2CP-C) TaxID=290397 RepID=Q2IIB6_ANADE|nr:PAS domain-containing sensor histidine kinase [Anaeromyxobacter dehalogenans]ABC81396.1 PAS/PAC sensor signal transduction histidine kinase [Anaeromyxobacter dehalogenans 2CP-C]